MKYILMFINDDRWEGMPEADRQAAYGKIGAWFGAQTAAGIYESGEELQPATTATTVRFKTGSAVVTDGPFMEAKETIGGYAIINVGDLDAAIAVAKTWPGPGDVEIRPLVDHSQDM